MKYPNGALASAAALVALTFALSGCDSIRSAAGITKQTPDEFAVVTKAPLTIPPDYNLRPPKPGAVPTNQTSPTGAAQAALYGNDDAANPDSVTGNYSQVEKTLLAQAGAVNADHSIRQQIASDEKSMQGADEGFTDKLLFGGPTDSSDKPVDADAENQKASDATKAGTQMNTGSSQTPQPATDDKKPDDSATIQKDNSGWLGGIF
jgi:hypothetical protein